MAVISIPAFSGISPRTGPTNLGATQAQVAANVKLQSGECRPWQNPVQVYTPIQSAVISIYHLLGPSGQTQWLEFTTDTDVVGPPQGDTTDYRIYYTSSGFTPRKTNWALATTGNNGTTTTGAYPRGWLNMGVPSPATALTLTPSGGSAPTEVRAYVYTYLSIFGSITEESAPSPAQLVTVNTSGSTVAISGWATAPTSNYNITAIRVYRTISGSTGVSYQYVDQIPVTATTGVVTSGGTSLSGVVLSGTTYNDTMADTTVGANPALTSTYYTPPPSTLQGIVSMPNGMLAGFTSNEVWFCEPYFPHAWPVSYMQTVDSPIVGLGVYNNTLVVTTTSHPYLMTGTIPSQVSVERLPIPQPCASKRSIAYDQYGVVYASPNGLVGIGNGIQDLTTTPLYTRDDWQLLSPSSMNGIIYNNLYIGFYTSASNTQSAIVMARNDTPSLVTYNYPAAGTFVDRLTGYIYAVSSVNNNIYQLDADPVYISPYTWQSKLFVLSHPVNFSALKVTANFAALATTSTSTQFTTYNQTVASALVAAIAVGGAPVNAGSSGGEFNGGIEQGIVTIVNPYAGSIPSAITPFNSYMFNGSAMAPIPTSNDQYFITVTVFADGVQIFSTGVQSNEPVRMPALEKYYSWYVTITGTVAMRHFAMATSIEELRGLSAAEALQNDNT